MSRLIDAGLLLDHLSGRLESMKDYDAIKDVVNNMPTAYDVGKVVEQLEALKENYRKKRENTYCRSTETDDCDSCRADHYLEARISTIDRVIEIVKGGGLNG